jgi:proteasome lid subunit RPN8/RPN11
VLLSATDFVALFPEIHKNNNECAFFVLCNGCHDVIYKESWEGTPGNVDGRHAYMLRKAIEIGAMELWVGHTHPSGHALPSPADMRMARKLKSQCSILGLYVVDVVVVGKDDIFSIRRMMANKELTDIEKGMLGQNPHDLMDLVYWVTQSDAPERVKRTAHDLSGMVQWALEARYLIRTRSPLFNQTPKEEEE